MESGTNKTVKGEQWQIVPNYSMSAQSKKIVTNMIINEYKDET